MDMQGSLQPSGSRALEENEEGSMCAQGAGRLFAIL